MNEAKTFVYEGNLKERLDVFLSQSIGKTRSYVKKLCDEGFVKIDGASVKSGYNLKNGDAVCVEMRCDVPDCAFPEDIPIDIVYQDSDVAVINKPQGMVVHAGSGNKSSTLVNALLYHLDNLSGINGVIRPGIVHRIDKNTSGLLVVAKNDASHVKLAEQLADKTCRRIYYALLEGSVKDDAGVIDTFIGRNPKDRKKMSVTTYGKRAITEYKVIERYNGYTLCEFSLKTGRTHQIRVHCKHIGHPIVGDPEYGYKSNKFGLKGQLLHAGKLEFIHPTTGKKVCFEAPLPEYFIKTLKILKNK